MNIKTELFLAWRYLKPKSNAVSVITCISVVGVTLGVAVLIVVLAVMTGFTDLMKEKLLETTAHIQIFNIKTGYFGEPDKAIEKIKKLGAKAAPVFNSPVLIQKGRRFVPKLALGVDPAYDKGTMNIRDYVKFGDFSLGKNEVIISNIIADEIKAYEGDKILIHSPDHLAAMVKEKADGTVELNKNAEMYLPDEYTIKGIYSFGKYDFDSNAIFLNIEDADELFGMPWGAATTIYVLMVDPLEMDSILSSLAKELPNCSIMSWKQINRKLLGVLQVEKNMMFFLLIFIVLVAAFSITNTLITVVVQKTREIGLLKALGASSGTAMNTFIFQGFFVGLFGTIVGNGLGIAVIYWRNELMDVVSMVTGMELFPKEFYYFNSLPAHIVPSDLLIISIASLLLCTIGGVIPALRAAHLDPAKALRYE